MTTADEISELDTAIASQATRQEVGIGLTAIGFLGVAIVVWVYAGLPGPELDHGMIQAQARAHGGTGVAAFAAFFATLAVGVVTTVRATTLLDALSEMRSSLREGLALEMAKRRRNQIAAEPRSQARRPPVPPLSTSHAEDDTAQLQAMTNTLLAVAAIEAISQADPAPSPEPAPAVEPVFSGAGGSFGGGGATGDFSAT